MVHLRISLASLVLVFAPFFAMADEASDKLLTALGMERMVQLMREEGLAYAVELGDEMLPGGYTEGWGAMVSKIYNTDAMETVVRRGFAQGLANTDLTPLEAFFYTPLGKTIISLELSAREAMMDDVIEEEVKEQARAYERARDDAFVLVDDFINASDLLETNVVGAMNSNIQFYRGLVDGGAFELSETEILSEVWNQEDETRRDTRDWLYGFLIMAYTPLEPGVIEDYTLLALTPEGRAMTAALFQGFDNMYSDISYALGLAAAQMMNAEEI
ncbi:DUF2059 domain-containing protein [Planktotalea sp.]|uniref:DUF2059 domain-containing protein n=1 Tax=Planktotalea sp. TaxID=2029877 RepID=UPI0032981861